MKFSPKWQQESSSSNGEGGFEDELVMLSIPCLILDFRRNFLLIRKKKKSRSSGIPCGFAGEGGDYGIWVRYGIVLLSHVSQVLVLSTGTSTPCECEEEKKNTLVRIVHISFYFYLLAKIMSRGGRSDGMVGFDILAASICSSTAARHRWMKQEAPV